MMRPIYLLLLLLLICSCAGKRKNPRNIKAEVEHRIEVPEFQAILDRARVARTLLIYDFQKKRYHSNDFDWANTGKLPASTFKIANSIIALETGVVENEKTIFKWDGRDRALKVWEQDLIFRDAFHFSCVPCYQDVARRIGSKRMNTYLDTLAYGVMRVDSTNIDRFWLEGESRISAFQQLDFLERLYTAKLPISQKTQGLMKDLMVIEDKEGYTLSGKTGWSVSKGINNGWFVGYIQVEKGTYFFATNVEPKGKFQQNVFSTARKEVVYKGLAHMKIID